MLERKFDRAAIAARIPHAGRMCLLDGVGAWDQHGIRCTAISHRDVDNPLRTAAGLPVWAGIEYAAQAAAMHASLLTDAGGPRGGVLAAARDVIANCERLDQIEAELELKAELLHRDPTGGIYRFEVLEHKTNGNSLLRGQFTLMFRDPPAGVQVST